MIVYNSKENTILLARFFDILNNKVTLEDDCGRPFITTLNYANKYLHFVGVL